jgi:hypothetical protein
LCGENSKQQESSSVCKEQCLEAGLDFMVLYIPMAGWLFYFLELFSFSLLYIMFPVLNIGLESLGVSN